MRVKFFIAFLSIIVVTLISSVLYSRLILSDIKDYMKGAMEDKVYMITASIEADYARHGWNGEFLRKDTMWALMLGYDITVKGINDAVIISTGDVYDSIDLVLKRRLEGMGIAFKAVNKRPYEPYPLFVEGNQVGTLYARPIMSPIIIEKGGILEQRGRSFLVFSMLIVGVIALFFSVLLTLHFTSPIRSLTRSSRAIGQGDFSRRVDIRSGDELGELSSAFNNMADALQRQDRLRRHLMSNAAHELRTPLTIIKGQIEGMIDGVIPLDREKLNSVYDDVERLGGLVNGIEDLTRAEAGRLSVNRIEVDLGEFLSGIVERFNPLFFKKGLYLNLKASNKLKARIDPDKTEQIINNILSNALKFTGTGGVEIGYERQDKTIVVSVKDTGIGINEADLPFIFERFYKTGEGFGIGLSIAKELAEAQAGQIKVESAKGAGSTFTLYLPV